MLVYFGYPQAHENDAERAVGAGLALVKGIGQLTPPEASRSSARWNRHRVGGRRRSYWLGRGARAGDSGRDTNLAARLQGLGIRRSDHCGWNAAPPRRLFELSGLAVHAQGLRQPVPAWRVRGEGRAESRFEALHGTRLTPLVGRGEELELVLSRWRQAKEDSGQVALILGEPGIGKSRLVTALRERLQVESKASVSYACSPHHVHSALFPFIAQLERSAGFAPDDFWERRLNRLELLLRKPWRSRALSSRFRRCARYPIGARDAIATMSPLQKKGLLFRTFLGRSTGWRRAARCLWCSKTRTGSTRHRGALGPNR